MADYFVSASGDDAQAGTREKPWRSLKRASEARLRPGDKLLLRGGDSFAGSLVLKAGLCAGDAARPLTVGSYGAGRAVIQAGEETGILVENLPGVIVRDLIFTGSGLRKNKGWGIRVANTLPGDARLRFVRVVGVTVNGFGQSGIFVGGGERDKGRGGFDDIEIARCEASESREIGIEIGGIWNPKATVYGNTSARIVECIARDNHGDPNKTDNHSGNGIIIWDTDDGVIEKCKAFRNGAWNGSKGGGPVGIWTHCANGVVIRDCESYENRTGGAADGGGFDLDGGATNCRIERCHSHDNDGAGYLVWNYGGAPFRLGDNVIRECRSENDGRKHDFYGGIHIGRDKSATIITNILLENNALTVVPKPGGVSPAALVIDGAEGVRIVGNALTVKGKIALARLGKNEKNEKLAFTGNRYSAPAAFLIEDGDRKIETLKDWRTAREPDAR